MKKFSRMPKSEGSGGGGTAGVGSAGGGGGASGVALGKVLAVGRYQVTPEELLAEGNGEGGAHAPGRARCRWDGGSGRGRGGPLPRAGTGPAALPALRDAVSRLEGVWGFCVSAGAPWVAYRVS